MTVHHDRALVLKRIPFGESSLVVHAIAPSFGRVNLLAKGAYRPTSRYFAVLDLFDTLELEWDASPARELATLRRGDLDRRRGGILAGLAHYRCALAILELLELVARPGASEAGLFAASERALDALTDHALPPEQALVTWELELLEHLGLSPALELCAACGGPAGAVALLPAHAPASDGGVARPHAPPVARANPFRARAAFSAGAGGRLCARCAREARAAGRRVGTLPIAVLDDARALWHDAARASNPPRSAVLEAARLERVRDFVERFLDYHLETQPKSHRAFLSVPNRNAPTTSERRR